MIRAIFAFEKKIKLYRFYLLKACNENKSAYFIFFQEHTESSTKVKHIL